MPSVVTYIAVMLGISIALYFFGYQSPFLAIVSAVGADAPFTDIANMLINAVLNPAFLIPTLTASVITSLAVGGRDFYVYLIPILSVFVMFNIFILPISYIYEAGFPAEISMMINAILNTFLVLGVIAFVRGGS